MRFCVRCLYPEIHPLNLTFDEHGVCSGCKVHEEKDKLDWSKRENRLLQIFDSFKNKSGRNYDCIVPVSGGRDSYFIVHTVKKKYGMNPLLISYNKQYNTEIGIRNLAYLKTIFDCDHMMLTVSPDTVKKITRSTMRRFGSIYWHCIAGQTVFPVQMAVKLKIPLIIWGAHQGIDQVGMFSHLDEVEMTRKYRKEHDLMGYEAEDLIDETDNITEQDIWQYKYPHDKEIEKIGVRGIYLNNYIRWDTKAQHEEMIRLYDYETIPQTRTFDSYNDVDCFNYSDVHDYIKYVKHGYGKATDHACREIRLRRMTREDGLALVDEYSRRGMRHLKLFLDWLGITEKAFHYIIDQHRGPAWERNQEWEWVCNLSMDNTEKGYIEAARLARTQFNTSFEVTPAKTAAGVEEYVLVGKGIPEGRYYSPNVGNTSGSGY